MMRRWALLLLVLLLTACSIPQTALSKDLPWSSTPAWQVAFISRRDNNAEIYLMNADGSQQINLTRNLAEDFMGDWSPDGRWILFSSNRDGNWEIYRMAADGSSPQNLSHNPAWDSLPVYSPDGRQIAFASERDGNPEVYVMNADGSDVRRLTQRARRDGLDLSWSPDGQWIAYVAEDADGFFDIWTMHPDGTGNINLTQMPPANFGPAYSLDGRWLAYSTYRNQDEEIYVMDVDGKNPRRYTEIQGTDNYPAWSPDGAYLLFTSERNGHALLYVMRADGTGLAQLTFTYLDDFYPRIRPVKN